MVGRGTDDERQDDVALDVSGILAAVLRRWLAVVVVTAVFGIGAFGILSALPPTYKAETKILIENRSVDLRRDATPAEDRTLVDQEGVASQVQLLLSRDLARQVAQSEGLADHPEFDGSRGSMIGSLLAGAGLAADPMRLAPEERVLDEFAKRLLVYRVEGSRVVVVEFSSEDPDLASRVANAVVAAYMTMQAEAKRRTSEDQTRWLGEEIKTLEKKVRQAESAVEAYRADNDLFVGENNASLARQQITALTSSLTSLQSDRAATQSRADLLRGLLSSGGDLSGATDVLDTEVFRTLRNRESALRAQLSELSVTLLPGHPQVKGVQAQLEEVRRSEVAEARRILAGMENDLKVADQRIAALGETLEQRKGTSAQNSESEVELRALEREAASQRQLLEGLLVKYREAVARQNAETMPADARVISRASAPVEPAFPKIVPLTVVATLAGLLLSLAWIITAEFISGRALKPLSPMPAKPLSLAPMAPGPAGPRESELMAEGPATGAVSERSDTFATAPTVRSGLIESAQTGPVRGLPLSDLGSLRTLILADATTRLAIMGVGSALAVEDAVAELSAGASAEGAKVVIVDTVPEHAGIGGPGLSDLIAGTAPFSEVIRRNPVTRAHEIGVGRRPLDGAMLAGPELHTLIDALEHTYDLVMLDLGILDGNPDRFRLIASVEHTILVGDPADPDVARTYGLLTGDGRTRVTVVPSARAVGLEAAA